MNSKITVLALSLLVSSSTFADYVVKSPLPEITITDQVSPDDITGSYSYSCADTGGALTFDFQEQYWFVGQKALQVVTEAMRNNLKNPTYGTGKYPCQTKVIHHIVFFHENKSISSPLCKNIINDPGFNLHHPINVVITNNGCTINT